MMWVAHIFGCGYPGWVKTTLDIADGLFLRAKAHAKATGLPLRAVVEEGLRLVLDRKLPAKPYLLRDDLAVGKPGKPEDAPPALSTMTPEQITELMYGDEIERIMGPAYVASYEAWANANPQRIAKGKKR